MATLYGVQLFDTEGKALLPGFGGAKYESDTALPVPHPGDSILSMGDRYTVENVTYEYKHEDNGERLIAAATIICRPVEE